MLVQRITSVLSPSEIRYRFAGFACSEVVIVRFVSDNLTRNVFRLSLLNCSFNERTLMQCSTYN